MCQKDDARLLSTKELAGALGCSEDLIRKVRADKRTGEKGKGKLVKIADELSIGYQKVAKATFIEHLEKLIPLK